MTTRALVLLAVGSMLGCRNVTFAPEKRSNLEASCGLERLTVLISGLA
jgi:hypothetical protein